MEKVKSMHSRLYNARWSGTEEDLTLEQLEDQFVSLATAEGVDLGEINIMMEQLYIPPYKKADLPLHLRELVGYNESNK